MSWQELQELRELRRRNWLLEQENEVLRRATAYLSQVNLPGKEFPARHTASVRRNSCDVDVSGLEAVSLPVLPVACSAGYRI